VGPAAVEMGKASRTPENAVERRPRCKMQQLLRLLLEPLQCASDLHFADTDAYKASAGDSLINNPQLLSGSKITWHRTGSRNVMRRFSDRFADSPPVAEAARVGGESRAYFFLLFFFSFSIFLVSFLFLVSLFISFLVSCFFFFLVSISIFIFFFLFLFFVYISLFFCFIFLSFFFFSFLFILFILFFLFLFYFSFIFNFFTFYFFLFPFLYSFLFNICPPLIFLLFQMRCTFCSH
jgi:hypothetical protein